MTLPSQLGGIEARVDDLEEANAHFIGETHDAVCVNQVHAGPSLYLQSLALTPVVSEGHNQSSFEIRTHVPVWNVLGILERE